MTNTGFKIESDDLAIQDLYSSVSNDLYETKKSGYAQSSYLLTRSLVVKPSVGKDARLKRAVEKLIVFDHWDSVAIETRQKLLAGLRH